MKRFVIASERDKRVLAHVDGLPSLDEFWKNMTALTATEFTVLRMVSIGMTNVQIARAMSQAITTTRTHIKRIHDKLYVVGRARLAVMGYEACYRNRFQ